MPSTNLPDRAEVLAEVNRLRAERDLPPLDTLPKGRPRRSDGCVIACALTNGRQAHVQPGAHPYYWFEGEYVGGEVEPEYSLPGLLAEFARAFDDGHFPEFEVA